MNALTHQWAGLSESRKRLVALGVSGALVLGLAGAWWHMLHRLERERALLAQAQMDLEQVRVLSAGAREIKARATSVRELVGRTLGEGVSVSETGDDLWRIALSKAPATSVAQFLTQARAQGVSITEMTLRNEGAGWSGELVVRSAGA